MTTAAERATIGLAATEAARRQRYSTVVSATPRADAAREVARLTRSTGGAAHLASVSTGYVDRIIRHEAGELDQVATIDLFADLVRSGLAWQLQGHYGRTATELIRSGVIDQEGEVLDYDEWI